MPELGPQQHVIVNAYIEDTANLTPAARAGAVQRTINGTGGGQIFRRLSRRACHCGRRRDEQRPLCVSSNDRRRTLDDGENAGWHRQRLGQRRLARLGKNRSCRDRPGGGAQGRVEPNPQALEARPMTAVLEPQAANDLVPLLSGALNARASDEGRSAFSKPGGGTRIGEKVMDERVTLYSDPADPDLLAMPFDSRDSR